MQEIYHRVTCELVEQSETLTLAQLCRSAGVQVTWVTLLVEQGVLEPIETADHRWHFPAALLPRVHAARRLAYDLGLDPSGIALALELMDEIRDLRARLNAYEAGPSR